MNKQQQRFQNRPFMENQPFMALAKGRAPVRASQLASNAFNNIRRLSQTEVDGVDHIIVGASAGVEIGYALDFKSHYRFTHNVFGSFATTQGFYNWLRSTSRDDVYRTATGRALDIHTKNNRDDLDEYVINFRYLIIDSIWQKIKTYPEMLAAFRESELPFEMYYTQLLDRNDRSAGTARTRPSIAQWVIPALQVLREAAKENIEPDLSYLIVDSVELEEFYEKYRAKVAHDEAVKAAKIQQFNAEKATMRQRAFTETVEQKGQQTSAAPVEETDVTNGDPDETEVKEATANIATEEPTVEASAQESSQQ